MCLLSLEMANLQRFGRRPSPLTPPPTPPPTHCTALPPPTHPLTPPPQTPPPTRCTAPPPPATPTAECEALLAQYGRNELEEKKKSKLVVFLKLLISPMAIALWVRRGGAGGRWGGGRRPPALNHPPSHPPPHPPPQPTPLQIAILIEAVLLDYVDVALLLAIQFANAGIAWYESVKAADAVAALKAGLKPRATVRRDGVWQTIDAALLVPGDLCKLAVGAAVPADVRVNVEGGVISVDASALTGESLPVTISGTSDKRAACMGSTVVRGEAEATVTATGSNTFFGRTAMLLNAGSGDDGGSLRRVILATTLALTIGSVVLCLGVLAYLIAYDKQAVRPALSFVVVLLVSAIPITIEIVSTTTLAMGAKQLSKHGAIVTRLSAIEEAAGMNILCRHGGTGGWVGWPRAQHRRVSTRARRASTPQPLPAPTRHPRLLPHATPYPMFLVTRRGRSP